MELTLNYKAEVQDRHPTIWLFDVPKGTKIEVIDNPKSGPKSGPNCRIGKVEIFIFEEAEEHHDNRTVDHNQENELPGMDQGA